MGCLAIAACLASLLTAARADTRSVAELLLLDGDVVAAEQAEARTGADTACKFLLARRFANDTATAAMHLLAAPADDPVAQLLLARNAHDERLFRMAPASLARLFMDIAKPIAQAYFENHFFFDDIERLTATHSKDIADLLTTIWAAHPHTVDRFISLIERHHVPLASVLPELEFLCTRGVAAAFGLLGDAHFYGIGVPQDTDRALDYYWAGRDRHDIRSYVGVGRVLMSEPYSDIDGALAAFEAATHQGSNAEAYYCRHMLIQRQIAAAEAAGTTVHATTVQASTNALRIAAVNGYLPAVYEFTAAQLHGMSGLTLSAGVFTSLLSITQYAPFIMETAAAAARAYRAGQYRQALLMYLLLAEFRCETALANAIHIMQSHEVIADQPRVLFEAYQEMLLFQRKYYKHIGDCYYYGRGTEASKKRAFAYYVAAMEYSNEGVYNTAYMYEMGEGVPQNLGVAYEYLSRHIKNGKCYLVVFYGRLRVVGRGLLLLYRPWIAAACAGVVSLLLVIYRFKLK